MYLAKRQGRVNMNKQDINLIVVEDDYAKFLSICLVLEFFDTLFFDANVVHLATFDEAEEYFEKELPSPDRTIVIMDLNMRRSPTQRMDVDTYELSRQLKKKYPDIVIIANSSDKGNQYHQKKLGNCDLAAGDDLLEAINQALDMIAQRQQPAQNEYSECKDKHAMTECSPA
ncbi:MAG: hypothetical protein CEN89_122 [Candidatus Berkelbacteria bacterium Licking1014_7]|uniref:Response regulatory domain-containing protein n=1 Tax=Candidatus Berkelbacteria bacterium Licking1014_7 TaxID=2017147 RepID=A0A554LL22_9BACT|nr:MAG: hypothetical protein CEN89_122 [Candidatus Berkelbacteria bacterium Licking1014_7]